MRIHCFWDNISKQESKTVCLKDGPVVIDGQNFFFQTYELSKLPFVFGAEANEYAKYLKKELQKFKDANVECYIVFKGTDTDIDKKIKKLWLTTFDFEEKYNYVSPILMKEIYKQVLEELGVKYATSVMEAKDDCVALAQALQCPTLSKDKEFYFKGTPYIPYLTLNHKPKNNYITCKQYHLKEFFHNYLLSDNKIAIFLALADTRAFPANYFNNLLKAWCITGHPLSLQLKNILQYLSKHNELEVLDSISKLFATELEKTNFMSQVFEKKHHNDKENVVINFLMGSQLRQDPRWFEVGVASQKIAIDYVHLYKHKCMMGSWAIEENDTTDSVMLSIDIIKYAYNLLTDFQPSQITVHQSSEKCVKLESKCDIARPMYQCKQSVFENGWRDIKQLKLFEHFLIMNKINTDTLKEIPTDATMLIITLVYFARKKRSENICVTKEVYCFIISYVMLNVVFDEKYSTRKIENKISENDSDTAKKATEKYFLYDNNEAKRIFNKGTLKTLSEIQYCLKHMNYLNTLCGSPFMTTKYHRTFNGTFIYKLLKDMADRDSDEAEFIKQLFLTAPSVYCFVNTLIHIYKKLL